MPLEQQGLSRSACRVVHYLYLSFYLISFTCVISSRSQYVSLLSRFDHQSHTNVFLEDRDRVAQNKNT